VSGRVAVIGLDCAEPRLVFDRWRDELPSFSRLMDAGTWGPLRSVDPPITVPAWSCMMTGRDPGELGIYGFRNRSAYDYHSLTVADSSAVKIDRVWDHLSRAGKHVITVGVPQTSPPVAVNGVDPASFAELTWRIVPWAERAWNDIRAVNGALPFRHDHYLKLWQLTRPRIGADYMMFDEAQDANPVIVAVVQDQSGLQKVAVGDSCQAIYGWRGAIDALATWPATTRLHLSQSFRFGPAVAEEANKWLVVLGDPFRGRRSTFRRDSLVRLLMSAGLTAQRDLIDRLNVAGDISVLFAQSRREVRSDPPLTAAEVQSDASAGRNATAAVSTQGCD